MADTPSGAVATPEQPGLKEVTQTMASTENLTNLFVNKVASRVDADLRAREARRQKIYALVFSILGVFGFGVVSNLISGAAQEEVGSALRKQEREQALMINAAVKKELDTQIDALKSDVQAEVEFIRLTLLAKAMTNQKDSVTVNQVSAVVDLIERICARDEFRSRPELADLLRETMTSLMAADLATEVDKVLAACGDQIERDKEACSSLLSHFAQRLIGNPSFPERKDEAALARVSQFSRVVAPQRPGLVNFWRLVRTHAEHGRCDACDVLFSSLDGLRDKDHLLVFYENLMRYMDPAWWTLEPTAEAIHLGRQVRALWDDYRADCRSLLIQAGESVQARIIDVIDGGASGAPHGVPLRLFVVTTIGFHAEEDEVLAQTLMALGNADRRAAEIHLADVKTIAEDENRSEPVRELARQVLAHHETDR